MSLSVSILPSTEQVCQRNYISKISKKISFCSKHTIFLHKFLCVLSVYMIKGFFVMDTLILPNAINTLNCHLYICVSPRLIHLHKGFKKG